VALRIERHDAVERGHKIAEHMCMRARQRHAQASVQVRQSGWCLRRNLRLVDSRFAGAQTL
jgi:hypothetical protein